MLSEQHSDLVTLETAVPWNTGRVGRAEGGEERRTLCNAVHPALTQ